MSGQLIKNKFIDVDQQDKILIITLNRPEKSNAINNSMHEDLQGVFIHINNLVESNSLGSIVIKANGKNFCAGQDLSERKINIEKNNLNLEQSIQNNYIPLINFIRDVKVPVVSCVQGVAAGAGLSLVMCTDLIVLSKDAILDFAFTRVALCPDTAMTWHLPKLVGPAVALGLTLTAEKLNAIDAKKIGIAWKVLDPDELETRTIEIAQKIASGPNIANFLTKKLIWESFENTLEKQLQQEKSAIGICGKSADYRNAILSFANKKVPIFYGK
jgi:2-(1,2-epoxy-1,2-dihydrophenyl)acetyl-CoA isomerase